ncbi:MAG: GNAT family N-acetyltransferase [Eubacterium sp.]|nr:GNAT family N-acetyltransferase [Eubacterium sp.]
MQICKIGERQLEKALKLIQDIFEECDREDYEEPGIQSFYHFIQKENMDEKCKSGEMVFFGAYDQSDLVGVIAMRDGFHVSLLFVRKDYQRQGIATRLVRRGIAYCLEQNPALKAITVSASPKGRDAYEAMGFQALTPEQKKQGMRFTPMRLNL